MHQYSSCDLRLGIDEQNRTKRLLHKDELYYVSEKTSKKLYNLLLEIKKEMKGFENPSTVNTSRPE